MYYASFRTFFLSHKISFNVACLRLLSHLSYGSAIIITKIFHFEGFSPKVSIRAFFDANLQVEIVVPYHTFSPN